MFSGIPVLSLVQERVQVMSHSNLMPTTTQSRATEALDLMMYVSPCCSWVWLLIGYGSRAFWRLAG
jgi:hypothetical protein